MFSALKSGVKVAAVAVLSVGVAGVGAVGAGDCPEPEPSKMMEIQGKHMAIGGPGPEHELLAGLEGEWEAEITMWMMAGADPVSSTMTSNFEPVLGGRFIQGSSAGVFFGMQMESINIFGYDRRHGHYTMVGFDSTGTYSISATGHYDAATKTLRFRGQDDDPIGGITQDFEVDMQFVSEDSYVSRLIFHCPTFGADGPHKLVEWTSTRKDS